MNLNNIKKWIKLQFYIYKKIVKYFNKIRIKVFNFYNLIYQIKFKENRIY